MPLIKSTLYKQVADLIDSVQYRNTDMLNLHNHLALVIDDSEVDDNNIDKQWLYNTFINSKETFNNEHYITRYSIKDIVREMQRHVQGIYGNVNNYLLDNNIRVYWTFASISAEVGFIIDDDNIIQPGSIS